MCTDSIIIKSTSTNEVGFNNILTQLVSKVLSTYFYDTKVVQILYPTSHKLNAFTYGFIFVPQDILNLLSHVHIKVVQFFN
jgi:hypothetical protein